MRRYARSIKRKDMVNVTRRFEHVRTFDALDPSDIDRTVVDFTLKLGHGPTPAWAVRASRHGVWFFEHETKGDLLPFLREFYFSESVTTTTLLAAREPDGEFAVLEEGWFRTEKRSYIEHRDRILAGISEWPARACRRLAQTGADRGTRMIRSAPSDIAPPRHLHFSGLIARIARQRLSFAWARLFRHLQWNIGILRVPVESLLRSGGYHDGDIEWFPLGDRHGFLADPFGVIRDGTLHILCEQFSYHSGKGTICSLIHTDQGFTRNPEPVMEHAVHLSYPFMVEDHGDIYCIPESSNADEVALFRADEFPRTWSKVCVLVEHVAGVDPTVFHHEGRWWLMCTQKGREVETALWIWHAPALAGPWTAHTRNPVKTDVRSARPGGMPFVREGVLFRPAQDCSRAYGWRIVVQKVTALTPSEFVEEPVAVVEASPHSRFPLGRHTLTPVGDVVLVDGHRAIFVWRSFLSLMRMSAADLWGRIRRGRQPAGETPRNPAILDGRSGG